MTHLDIFASFPAGVRDPHAHNVGLLTVGDHALALRGCESGLDQFDHHVDREAVRTQDSLGVTVTAPGKQLDPLTGPMASAYQAHIEADHCEAR
jgi:hypothetical protein